MNNAEEVMVIYTLFPNADDAHRACRILLDEELVACANRYPAVTSHYKWNNMINVNEEHPVFFKTSRERTEQAMARLAELHSFAVPAIVSWPSLSTYPPFSDWVQERVANPQYGTSRFDDVAEGF
jgi:periplasmic divalent cation tolerance protein